jgi:hypothetical protein
VEVCGEWRITSAPNRSDILDICTSLSFFFVPQLLFILRQHSLESRTAVILGDHRRSLRDLKLVI